MAVRVAPTVRMPAMPQYPALKVTPKTGDESFHHGGQPVDFRVLDFWRWGVSDLVDNVKRVDLIRFGGHLPKGGYDVPNGRNEKPTAPSAVHG
jgi:hypothetical protein